MLYLLEEEGQAKVGTAVGLVVVLIVVLVLVVCCTCATLLVLGPQIGNVFSRVNSGLSGVG